MQALVVRFNFCLRLFLMIGILPHPLPGSLSVWVFVPSPTPRSELLPSSSVSLSRSRWIQPSGWRRCPPGFVRSTHPRGPQEPHSSLPGNPWRHLEAASGLARSSEEAGRFRLLGGFEKGLGAGGDEGQEKSRDRLAFPHSRVFPPALFARLSSALSSSLHTLPLFSRAPTSPSSPQTPGVPRRCPPAVPSSSPSPPPARRPATTTPMQKAAGPPAGKGANVRAALQGLPGLPTRPRWGTRLLPRVRCPPLPLREPRRGAGRSRPQEGSQVAAAPSLRVGPPREGGTPESPSLGAPPPLATPPLRPPCLRWETGLSLPALVSRKRLTCRC